MPWRSGGRCCWRSKRRSGRRTAAAQRRLLTFVIVGGGPTGVELAGALAEIARRTLRQDFRNIRPESARIVLVEGSPHVLGTFPVPLGEAARRSLTALGVEVRTRCLVTAVDAEGRHLAVCRWRRRRCGRDERLAAKTVLWAAGVAASPLATSLGVPLDRAGRVLAEPTLAVPGRSGHLCRRRHLRARSRTGGPCRAWRRWPCRAARTPPGTSCARSSGQPLEPFRYRDYGNMATIGRGSAVADIGRFETSGFVAWLLWLFIHIFWLIGFRNRVAVLLGVGLGVPDVPAPGPAHHGRPAAGKLTAAKTG